MELIVFIGPQAAGKSSFYRARFFDSHLRLDLDVLRTRHRERLLFEAVLASKTPCVIDNCNATRAERARYLGPALAAGFRAVAYRFVGEVDDWLARNRARGERAVPDRALLGTVRALEAPTLEEGFASCFRVRAQNDSFELETVYP